MKRLLFLLLAFASLSAFDESQSPELTAALCAPPQTLIDGKVSVITGGLVLQHADLVANGAQPITLWRYYALPTLSEWTDKRSKNRRIVMPQRLGWTSLNHVMARYGKGGELVVTAPSGLKMHFDIREDGSGRLCSPTYGMHNAGPSGPGAHYDVRNTQVSVSEDAVVVTTPNGTIRNYRPGIRCLQLHHERLPNGKFLFYEYDEGGKVSAIWSGNQDRAHEYARFELVHDDMVDTVTTHTGLDACYQYQHEPSKLGNQKLLALRQIGTPACRRELACYDDNHFLKSWKSRDSHISCKYALVPMGCVKTLRLTHLRLVNSSQSYTFEYEKGIPGETVGSTCVIHADGFSDKYTYDANLLLTSIDHLDQNRKIVYTERYSWSPRQHLASIVRVDAGGKPLVTREFECDEVGNPILERRMGRGVPLLEIRRRYSQDRFHLLLEETDSLGRCERYAYLEGTNLPLSHSTWAGESLIQETRWRYDECFNLLEKEARSGPKHHITRYTLNQHPPFLHLPITVEEFYFDQGVERFLSKTHFSYDAHGRVNREEVCNALGEPLYCITRTYNERGDVTRETDPIGNETCYRYDVNGRSLEQSCAERITRIQRNGAGLPLIVDKNGTHQTTYTYNKRGWVKSRENYLGQQTQYEYDSVHGKVSRREFADAKWTTEYDATGAPTSRTNPNGHRTTILNNGLGQPRYVLHPDDACEHFSYDARGDLISHTDPDGLEITYLRDPLGRILETLYSHQGREIASERSIYSGSFLIESVDREGHSTHYTYDGAGRLSSETYIDRIITYEYDALGNLSHTCHHNGPASLHHRYTYDNAGQLLEHRQEDLEGRILRKIGYTYNLHGERTQIVEHISDNEKALCQFEYDSFGRLTSTTDPLGQTTRTDYNENFFDIEWGARLRQTITTSPSGRTTTITYDP